MREDTLEEKLKKLAMELTKHEAKKVNVDGKDYLLVGTCLAYEDDVCEDIRDAFMYLIKLFDLKVDVDRLEDFVSEVRDEVVDKFEQLL